MGCLQSQQKNDQCPQLVRKASKQENSTIGKLVIKIKSISLQKVENKDVKISDLLLKIRLSNQDQQIKIDELKKQPVEQRKFAFTINSCHKSFGRFLLLEVWNLKGKKQTDTGLGFINLSNLLPKTQDDRQYLNKKVKTSINYSQQPGGFIELQLDFLPFDYEELTIKVNSVFLHRHVEGKVFAAKVCIGEQNLDTSPITANDRNQLVWEDQIFTFKVPSFVQFGQLKIVEKKGSSDLFWGQYILNVREFLNSNNFHQVQIDDELQYDHTVSGRVRLSSKRGNSKNLTFRQIDSPMRGRQYETSIRMSNASMTDQNIESSKDFPENDFSFSVYRSKRSASLPPLDLNEALKKLQFKRKKVAKQL